MSLRSRRHASGPGFNDGDFDSQPDEQSPDDRASRFMTEHTDFLSYADTTSPSNADCPICFEGIEDHICVKITNIPGCQHLIGLKCLEELLKRNPDEKVECPLCRAEWCKSDGIWQDEFMDMVGQGRRGGNDHPSRLPQIPSYGYDDARPLQSTDTSRRPSFSRYPSADPFDMPFFSATLMHPLSPVFGSFGPMDAFGLDIPQDIAKMVASLGHGQSRSSQQLHATFHPPRSSHNSSRPPRYPPKNDKHPDYIGPDGELMVWVDDETYNAIEASRAYEAARSRPSRHPPHSARGAPCYPRNHSSRPFRDPYADRSAGGFHGVRDPFGGQYDRC